MKWTRTAANTKQSGFYRVDRDNGSYALTTSTGRIMAVLPTFAECAEMAEKNDRECQEWLIAYCSDKPVVVQTEDDAKREMLADINLDRLTKGDE